MYAILYFIEDFKRVFFSGWENYVGHSLQQVNDNEICRKGFPQTSCDLFKTSRGFRLDNFLNFQHFSLTFVSY